ncbi:MAG: type IV pilus inner membrane component PilO [Thermoanaerobaculia bacterium]
MALTLEGKPWYWGFGIGLFLAIALVAATHWFVIKPIDQRIVSLNTELDELSKKIEQGRAAEKKLPQFRDEVRKLEQELEKFRLILPSTRNTEQIIKKIKSLVDQGDFTLIRLTFPKLAEAQGGDPYSEWPITVAVEGGYHNLAILFDKLSKFSRIVNVEEFDLTALTMQIDKTLEATFVAKTFVYSEPKEAAPAAGAPGGAAPPSADSLEN